MRDLHKGLQQEHIEELLDRYFLGSLSQEDTTLLRLQLRQAGVDLRHLEQLRAEWATPWTGRHTTEEWVERIREHLQVDSQRSGSTATQSRLQPSVPPPHLSPGDPGRWFPFSSGSWKYAISALGAALFVIVGGWYLQHRTSGPSGTSYSTYTTGNGERATITLPDGTTVRLNVASRLLVPSTYTEGNRVVQLTGEAMFTVTHRSRTPFVVSAGPSTTRVLGTTFVVRHYATDTLATIAVRDGKVAVGETVVGASQQVTVNTTGIPQFEAADRKQFSFTEGVLVLNSMPLIEAVPELNRWYDAEIRLGDNAIQKQRILGGFKAGSITDLISILEMTYDVRVERAGRVLTLYTKG